MEQRWPSDPGVQLLFTRSDFSFLVCQTPDNFGESLQGFSMLLFSLRGSSIDTALQSAKVLNAKNCTEIGFHVDPSAERERSQAGLST